MRAATKKMLFILRHGPSRKSETLTTAFSVFQVKASKLNPQRAKKDVMMFALFACESKLSVSQSCGLARAKDQLSDFREKEGRFETLALVLNCSKT